MSKLLLSLAIATCSFLFSCSSNAPLQSQSPDNSETKPQLRFYGGPRTRSSMVQWYLAELNLPYEYVEVNLQAGDNLKPEYLAINPMGQVPAIVDGDLKLWESGAILLYLANKYDPQNPTSLEQQAKIPQ